VEELVVETIKAREGDPAVVARATASGGQQVSGPQTADAGRGHKRA